MDQVLTGFELAFGKAADRAAGSILVGLVVFLLIMAVSAVVYFANRHRSGMNFQWNTEVSPEREKLLRTLDTAEGYVARFYLLLLYLVMVGATAMMAFLYLKYPEDGNRNFMLFYGGAIYIVGMLALSLHVSKMRQRLNPRPQEESFLSQFHSKVNVKMDSSPHVQVIDIAKLNLAQQRLDAGGSIDEACAVLDERYQSMNGVMKNVFRQAMEVALNQHRLSVSNTKLP